MRSYGAGEHRAVGPLWRVFSFLVFVSAGSAGIQASGNLPPLVCGLNQLSETSSSVLGGEPVALSPDGKDALILSRQDFVGSNRDGNLELFRVELDRGRFEQITRTSGVGFFTDPRIRASEDLKRIVFQSRSDPAGRNPEGALQNFLFDVEENRFLQLTSSPTTLDGKEPLPVISGDGDVVAWVSRDDPSGENADGSREVFVYDVDHDEVLQATRLPQSSIPLDLSLNRDGNLLAFVVQHFSYTDVQLFNLNSGQSLPVQVGEHLVRADLSRDGKTLFVVSSDDLTGQNSDGGYELFSISLDSDGPGEVRQWLNLSPSRDISGFSDFQVLDGAVLINSSRSLRGFDSRGSENLFVLNLESMRLEQLTYFTTRSGRLGEVRSDAVGRRLLIGSRSDPVARNRDGNQEAFLADCSSGKTAYFPQIGDGQIANLRFKTSFVFTNNGDNSSVRMEFFAPDGSPLAIPLVDRGTVSTLQFDLPRGTPAFLETTGFGSLKVGYARVSFGSGITGTAVYTGAQASPSVVLYEAAVPLTETLSEFSIVVNTEGLFQTGIAMVNAGSGGLSAEGNDSSEAEVRLRLFDKAFQLVAEAEVELDEGQQTAFFVDRASMNAVQSDEMQGTLVVTSSQPLAVITLRQYLDPAKPFPFSVPTLTTFPVAPGNPIRESDESPSRRPFDR